MNIPRELSKIAHELEAARVPNFRKTGDRFIDGPLDNMKKKANSMEDQANLIAQLLIQAAVAAHRKDYRRMAATLEALKGQAEKMERMGRGIKHVAGSAQFHAEELAGE